MSSSYSMFLSTILCLVVLFVSKVNGRSNGAGGCAGGAPAVGLTHVTFSSITTGTIEDGEFQVQITDTFGNVTILDFDTPTTIDTQTDYTLSLSSPTGRQFRGILFRLENPNGDISRALTLDDDSMYKSASYICPANVASITHGEPSLKDIASANLRIDVANDDLQLDVNVVVQNKNLVSIYYYSGYTINVVGDSAMSTPAPAPVRKCGIFGLGWFCPNLITFSFCGFIGRWFGLCFG